MTIKKRLSIFVISFAALFAVAMTVAIRGNHSVAEAKQESLVVTTALRNHLESDMMHDAIRGDVISAFVASTNPELAKKDEVLADLKDHVDTITALQAENAKLPLPAELKSKISAAQAALVAYKSKATEVTNLAFVDSKKAASKFPEFYKAFSDLEEQMESVSEALEKENTTSMAHLSGALDLNNKVLWLLTIAAGIFGLFSAKRIFNQIETIAAQVANLMKAPFEALSKSIKRMAAGDLTSYPTVQFERADIKTAGEFAGPLNEVIETAEATQADLNDSIQHMGTLILDVQSTMAIVRDSSSKLRDACLHSDTAAGEISQGTQVLATSAEQTTATMERLIGDIDRSYQAANTQQESAAEAFSTMSVLKAALEEAILSSASMAELVTQGTGAVKQTVASMEAIDDRAKFVAGRVSDLSARSEEISKITQTIQQLSDQTNLLALNAAIEAARAGEHGKGFAVVADEVRKLSEHSSAATSEIVGLIEAIQSDVTSFVKAIEEMNGRVTAGSEQSNAIDAAFAEIRTNASALCSRIESSVAQSAQVESLIDQLKECAEVNLEVSSGVKEQATEVTHSMSEVCAVSQQSAAGSQQLSAITSELRSSADRLADSATSLQSQVETFQVLRAA